MRYIDSIEPNDLFTEQPNCLHDEQAQIALYDDRKIGKVTYRVWSVFYAKETTQDRLATLMQRQVESGADVKRSI